jgi:hypothetical protein
MKTTYTLISERSYRYKRSGKFHPLMNRDRDFPARNFDVRAGYVDKSKPHAASLVVPKIPKPHAKK